MYIPRVFCPVAATLKSKSVLLLGPRRTGKTLYIKNELKPDRIYNLLINREYVRLAANPGLIREELKPGDRLVVVDEIQKLPSLMDEIHDLIETSGVRFLLTGSSARKLRRTHTSLMAGRARVHHLLPFVYPELASPGGPGFDLDRILTFGSLPPVLLSRAPGLELEDYAGAYLREEIQAEAMVRKIENFSRFLRVAALSNAGLVNFSEVARDSQVPPRTIIEYFSILEDTLLGAMLPPFKPTAGQGVGASVSRKAYSMGKFYFFDIGVANFLAGQVTGPMAGVSHVPAGTPAYGKALEQLICLELRAYKKYLGKPEPLSFWRTYDGREVDFVVGDSVGIEVKASGAAHSGHLRGLRALDTVHRLRRKIVVSLDPRRRAVGDFEIIPVREFLEMLWGGDIF